MTDMDSSLPVCLLLLMLAAECATVSNIRYARIRGHTRLEPTSDAHGRRLAYYSRYSTRKYMPTRILSTYGTRSDLGTSSTDGISRLPPLSVRSFSSKHKKLVGGVTPKVRGARRHNSGKSYMNLIINALKRYDRSGNRSELVNRLEKILTLFPGAHDNSIHSLRKDTNRFKQKSRAEHRRIWLDLLDTKREFGDLMTMCETLRNNLTALGGHFEQHTSQYTRFMKNANQKMEQIESHQSTQDLRYFDTVESTMNNTGLLSQLKKQIEREIRNLSAEKRTITRDLASIQRRLQIIFNQELNQQRSSLGQLQIQVSRQTDQLKQVGDDVNANRAEIDTMNVARVEMQSAVSEATQEIEQLQEGVRETDKKTYELMLQTSARLDGLGSLQDLIVDLNDTVRRSYARESYLESRILSVERKLLRLNRHLIKQLDPLPTKDLEERNEVVKNNQTSELSSVTALSETGFEDRLDRMSRSLQHHNHKLENVTSVMRGVMEDVRSLSITTSNYFTLINEHAAIIRKQNETINALNIKFNDHEAIMATHLEYQHGTIRKLMTIVSNLARQIRQPLPQHKDCHDYWRNGHPQSGVYTFIKEMQMIPVYCNMTADGGWTVIQRRSDGTQDFDKGYREYERGFGSVYGEHWLGLDNMRWLTHGRMYSLKVILEDWTGRQRYALYDKFMVFGQHYLLAVSGYSGDAGDEMMDGNDEKFQVRKNGRDTTVTLNSDCSTTRRAGWWFPKDCGEANPNGPYQNDPQLNSEEMQESFLNQQLEWMRWGDTGFALKTVSMQIIPREALIESDFSTLDNKQVPPTSQPTRDDSVADGFDDVSAEEDTDEELPPPYREISVQGQ